MERRCPAEPPRRCSVTRATTTRPAPRGRARGGDRSLDEWGDAARKPSGSYTLRSCAMSPSGGHRAFDSTALAATARTALATTGSPAAYPSAHNGGTMNHTAITKGITVGLAMLAATTLGACKGKDQYAANDS